jgi:hypothetical protein
MLFPTPRMECVVMIRSDGARRAAGNARDQSAWMQELSIVLKHAYAKAPVQNKSRVRR